MFVSIFAKMKYTRNILRTICFKLVFLLLLPVFVACSGSTETYCYQVLEEKLKEGDIVFRCGPGVVSRTVLFLDKGGIYSHIGLVVRDKSGWYVIHAVPGEPDYQGDPDRVKMESIRDFFSPERASAGAVVRLKCDSVDLRPTLQSARELYLRRTLFDHNYDLEDTTKMYCTEFIAFVFKKSGLDLVPAVIKKVPIPGRDERCILPSDIYNRKDVELIYSF